MFEELNDFSRFEELNDFLQLDTHFIADMNSIARCREQVGKKFVFCKTVNYNKLIIQLPLFKRVMELSSIEELPAIDERGRVSQKDINSCLQTKIEMYRNNRYLLKLLSKNYTMLEEKEKDFILSSYFKTDYKPEIPDFIVNKLEQLKATISLERQQIAIWDQEKKNANKYLFKIGDSTSFQFACKMLPNFAYYFNALDDETRILLEEKYIKKQSENKTQDQMKKELFCEIVEMALDNLSLDMKTFERLQQYETTTTSDELNAYLQNARFYNPLPEWVINRLKLVQADINGKFIGPLTEEQSIKKMR